SALPFSSLTSAATTLTPAACRRRTVASPMPPVPPTTTAEAPVSCIHVLQILRAILCINENSILDAAGTRLDPPEPSRNLEPGFMPEAVIVSALRTPIGTARRGTLRDTTAFELADHVVRAAAQGLAPERVDDVILAEGLAGGGVIARHAAITAGLTNVPGLA